MATASETAQFSDEQQPDGRAGSERSRQIVQGESRVQRRYLAVVPATADEHGAPVQIQVQK